MTGPEVQERWELVSAGETWQFQPGPAGQPSAELRMTSEQAWRLLTNDFDADLHGRPAEVGDPTSSVSCNGPERSSAPQIALDHPAAGQSAADLHRLSMTLAPFIS